MGVDVFDAWRTQALIQFVAAAVRTRNGGASCEVPAGLAALRTPSFDVPPLLDRVIDSWEEAHR